MQTKPTDRPMAALAKAMFGLELPLSVLETRKGFYLGSENEQGPVSRESQEYWPTRQNAEDALLGRNGQIWTQRTSE